MYNLNYTPTTLGVQVEEKLYLGVREQKRLNTTAVGGPKEQPTGFVSMLIMCELRSVCLTETGYAPSYEMSVAYLTLYTHLGRRLFLVTYKHVLYTVLRARIAAWFRHTVWCFSTRPLTKWY
jgi:hypothetical protein